VASTNLVPCIFNRISVGKASKITEKGGEYVQEDIPRETMVDLCVCIRLLVSSSLQMDPSVVFTPMHLPKRDPLEAIAELFLKVDLEQRGIDACGSLLCEFRSFSVKLKGMFDETMENKLDQALDEKRNPVMSTASSANLLASRRRTVVAADREHLLWRCKSFDVLPNKYLKKGVVGGARDEVARLEAEIRAMEAVLTTKRRMLLEGTKSGVSRDFGKV
jgi:hypothetical protein